MTQELSVEILSHDWKKISQFLCSSGKMIRTYGSNEGCFAILKGHLDSRDRDPLSMPILHGSFTLILDAYQLSEERFPDSTCNEWFSSDQIVNFLIEKLHDL